MGATLRWTNFPSRERGNTPRVDGKHGAGVPGYGARGTGFRGVQNTGCGEHGVWKTRGVENTGSGWKTRGLVENTGSEWKTQVFNEKTRGNYFFAKNI